MSRWLLRGAVLVPTLVVWELLVLRTGNLDRYPAPRRGPGILPANG